MGGWGQVADCVQWLCYLVQLILAQWCLCLPVIIDHCIPTPDTHNHWVYILHHRSVINVIICKLLVTQNNRTPATVILVVGPRVVIWIFSGWIVMIVMTRLDIFATKCYQFHRDWGWTLGQVVISQIISNIHPRQH